MPVDIIDVVPLPAHIVPRFAVSVFPVLNTRSRTVTISIPQKVVIIFVVIFEVIGCLVAKILIRRLPGGSGRVFVWERGKKSLSKDGTVGGHGATQARVTGNRTDVRECIAHGPSPKDELLGGISAAHVTPRIAMCPG